MYPIKFEPTQVKQSLPLFVTIVIQISIKNSHNFPILKIRPIKQICLSSMLFYTSYILLENIVRIDRSF